MTVLHLPPADPVSRVVQRLRDAGRRVRAGSRGQYEAQCPAHDDGRESLGVGTGRDGRALVTCMAGCALPDILRALDLTERDLFADRLAPSPGARMEFTHTYQYRDEQDRVLFEVCRTADKQFRQRVPLESGGYAYKLNGVRRVLYHLGEVLEAVASDRTVYVCEGEKDVENLRAIGLVATTNAGGASKADERQQKWLPEYTQALRGAPVVVLPDNDEPGRAHAQLVADQCTQAGCTVKVVVLPGVQAKGDVSDWLAAGGSRPALEALVLDTPRWIEGSRVPTEAPARLPRAVRLADAPPPTPITWLIDDLWTAGDIGLLVGDGGSFKTTTALHMACCVAGGYPVFGQYACRQAPALIVSAEDPQSVLQQRADAFITGQQWDGARVKANLHVLASPDATLADPTWQRHLEAEVDRIRPAFLVIDPLAELLGGDENSNSEVRPAIKFLRALAERTGAAVAIVHHAGKAGGEKRTLDRIRGASAINSAARVIYFFEFKDDGVHVEPLKLSRAAKPPKFVLTRHVQADPANRAVWTSAALSVATARVHVENRAETFIRAQLRASQPLSSSDLKRRAHGTSIRAEDLSRAISILDANGVIHWEGGPRNARLWRLTESMPDGPPHPERGWLDALASDQEGY